MPLKIKLVLFWIVICFGSLLFARFLLGRYPPKIAYSLWSAIYAALKILPIALFFSPTIFISGWFGFPAPACLVLLHCIFDPEFQNNNNELIRKNLGLAMIGFIGFWLTAWFVSLIRRSRKLQKETAIQGINPTENIILLIGMALILFTIVVYYFGFCYGQPPSGMPVYSGP